MKRKGATRRRGISRAQALVELAMFFPLLMFMVVGSTDISTLLDDHLNIVYAARTGARTGSVMGSNAAADCAVIGAIHAALVSNRNITLTQIDIYDADAQSGQDSSTTPHDIYPGNAQCDTSSGTPTITVAATTTTWPPSTRIVTPFTEDSIGVQLTYTYNFDFPLLGQGTFGPATDYAVMPLEVVVNASS